MRQLRKLVPGYTIGSGLISPKASSLPVSPKPGRFWCLSLLCALSALAACRTLPGDSDTEPPGSEPTSKAESSPGLDDPGRDEVRIVFFGDSITKAGTRPDGYVTLVTEALSELYPRKDIEVVAAGVTGDTVGDLVKRVDEDVVSESPTHVVIYIGVNEVGQRRESASISQEDRRVYHDGLTEIVNKVKAAGARPFLCTPAVFGDDPDSRSNENRLLDEYAAISREVAGENGARLCDLRTAFSTFLRIHNDERRLKGVVTVDGVHLNERGNRLVAEHILEILDLSEPASA